MTNYIRQATLQFFVLPFCLGGLSSLAFADSLVPQTGQTNCYDTFGVEITCADTGQDGDLRKGVEWPIPRFTDNGDGTVTDHLTNLVWVQKVTCVLGDWQTALDHANNLADGQCGLSDGSQPGDWRLPNIRELLSLFDYSEGTPALPAGHPFLEPADVGLPVPWRDAVAWSSTTQILKAEPSEYRAYAVALSAGSTVLSYKTRDFPHGAWAVRDAPPPPTECSDGIDNDGDGRIDLDDKQCRSADQDSEKHPNR